MADFQASFLEYAAGLITSLHASSVLLSIRTVRAGSVIVEGALRFALHAHTRFLAWRSSPPFARSQLSRKAR
jgi:hypothetical protein